MSKKDKQNLSDTDNKEADKFVVDGVTYNPYSIDKTHKIPVWLKAYFIKFWFAGMVCYFMVWAIQWSNAENSALACGIVYGMVTDLLINVIFRMIASDKHEYDKYMMFGKRKLWNFFFNVIYYTLILYVFVYTLFYGGINSLLINIFHWTTESVPLAVEPIIFGLATVLFDCIFLNLRNLAIYIVKRVKAKRAALAEQNANISTDVDADGANAVDKTGSQSDAQATGEDAPASSDDDKPQPKKFSAKDVM